MPDDPKIPDSLGDSQTLSGKKKAPAKSKQSLGDDERLRVLLEAGAELPESVKTAVMEMVGG